MASPYEIAVVELVLRASTLQRHKQRALKEMCDKHMAHHAERVRNRLSSGVTLTMVRDEWQAVVDILTKHIPAGEK